MRACRFSIPFVLPPKGWMRMEVPGTWGRYRHTVAGAFPGDGGVSVAVRGATSPKQVVGVSDYHLPDLEFRKDSPGRWWGTGTRRPGGRRSGTDAEC